MSAVVRIARRVAHAAALIFGAWWLVATSAEHGPRRCFTGIGNPTRLEVTVGSRQSTSSTMRNCAQLDGLMENSTLVFDLSQAPPPEEGCYDYETQAFSGVNGVTLSPVPLALPTLNATWSLTSVSGTFVSPEMPACTGNWALALHAASVPDQELVSPLDAGPGSLWLVQRQIRINRASSCGGLFSETGVFTCFDEYLVASITELPAP